MKKTLLFVLILMFCFLSGCDDIEDLADITVEIVETEAFPVIGGTGVYSTEVDVTDNNDYTDYDDYIKKVEIKSMEYKVVQNLGSAGTFTLYVSPLASPPEVFADATQVTTQATFAQGVTTPDWAPVTLTNKAYFEELFLKQGKFVLWGEVTTSGISAVEIVVKFTIKITANPFEKL